MGAIMGLPDYMYYVVVGLVCPAILAAVVVGIVLLTRKYAGGSSRGLPRPCQTPGCGFPNPRTARFCHRCGRPLG